MVISLVLVSPLPLKKSLCPWTATSLVPFPRMQQQWALCLTVWVDCSGLASFCLIAVSNTWENSLREERFVLLIVSVRHGGRVWWRSSHLDRQETEQSGYRRWPGPDLVLKNVPLVMFFGDDISPARLYHLQLHHLPITNSYLASINGLDHSFSQSPGGLIIFINVLIDTPRSVLS